MNKPRESEILLSWGATVALISKRIGVSGHACCRRHKEHGGTGVDQAREARLEPVARGCWNAQSLEILLVGAIRAPFPESRKAWGASSAGA